MVLLQVTGKAEDVYRDGVWYNLYEPDQTASVTYHIKLNKREYYKGDITIQGTIKVNDKKYVVKRIGLEAFKNCTELTSVSLPNTIETIYWEAFRNCTNLQTITIPNSVKEIGMGAFDASGLTTIDIPNSVTEIGFGAFRGCKSLTSVTMPNSVTSLGDEVFHNCSSLTSITIPNSIQKIGRMAFSGCVSLTAVSLPESVKSIGDYAFRSCRQLTSISIPNSVNDLGAYAFSDCSQLASIDIPNTVKTIGTYAFWGCTKLTAITIPNPIKKIEDYTFYGCSSLSSIYLPENPTSFEIGQYAFAKCSSLASISLPNTLKSVGKNAFLGCVSLPIEDGIRYASMYLIEAADKNQEVYTIKTGTKYIGYSAFYNCKNLKQVEIPNTVTILQDSAFCACESLSSIDIPNSVTTIGESAFEECSSLSSIDIPNSVTSIGGSAFAASSLSSIDIPNSVASIASSSFYGCTNLQSVVIPASVRTIGGSAFYGCTNLQSITLPNSVNDIGLDAFNGGSYPINCYPVPYYKIMERMNWSWGYEYGNRIKTCGGDIYDVVCTDSTLATITCLVKNLGQQVKVPEGEEVTATDFQVKLSWGFAESTKSIWLPIPEDSTMTIKNLHPNIQYRISLGIKYNDGNTCYTPYHSVYTKDLLSQIKVNLGPTSLSCQGSFEDGEAHITQIKLTAPPQEISDSSLVVTGLSPSTNYTATFTVKIVEGSTETTTTNITTPALDLTTLQPRGVSSTCSIVAAETNIVDEEMNVGFQWKKYDAPASLNPSEGYAAIYNGRLEGYIKNLQPTSYYNVRAFYKSAAGNYYYSDWVTFDPSDFSYFEPTVHTYPASAITEGTASVRGYVLAGTDDITEQGFEYWPQGSAAVQSVQAMLAPDTEVSTVLATGQVMQVVLDGLKPATTYIYRAFVKTTAGTTYGEEQQFTTSVPSGIFVVPEAETATPTVIGYYDLSGRRYAEPRKGLNILRYSDGSSRKVFVK